MISMVLLLGILLTACQPAASGAVLPTGEAQATPPVESTATPAWQTTAFPTRPPYAPGELVEYIAQTGDTLPALAQRFNTSVEEILQANSFIPANATTMPPGMPMQIPIYYLPFWGSPYRIIPDSLFINGPAQVGFNTADFVAEQPGWLNGYMAYAFGGNRSGAQIVDYVAVNFSVSPRLLLVLLEYQAGALSQPTLPLEREDYPLGYQDWRHRGLYLQLVWAANLLNNGYYGWRIGSLTAFDHLDGRVEHPDPWQNAGTVALQYYFSRLVSGDEYQRAIAHDGYARVYRNLFGDPWAADVPHLPGSLAQPEFTLPFRSGLIWALTGGPHTGFGEGEPLAALDFAPGAMSSGCTPSSEWTTAVAGGVVARSELGTVVLDLDGDGDERTGWVVFYFHIATEGRASVGTGVQTGDPLGHPSCEGGRTTGTHVHLARKYNGEWIMAGGILAFNMEGWMAHNGSQAYQGSLQRGSQVVTACECANASSQIEAGR